MKFEYFPQDIVETLESLTAEKLTDNERENCIGAVYDLKAICENRHNAEYYRDFYRLLERVCGTDRG